MSKHRSPNGALVAAKPPAPTTVFVCKKCDAGAEVRAALKSAIKAERRTRDVAVVGCACLDVCPKRGATAAVLTPDTAARYVVVPARAVGDPHLLAALVDERVGDPVAEEHGPRLRLIVDERRFVVDGS